MLNSSVFQKCCLAVVFLAWLACLLFCFDATATSDTLDQINSALQNDYINWKPPIHSWLMLQAYHLGGSSDMAVEIFYFIQLFFFGLGVCLITAYLARFRSIYLFLCLALFAFNPVTIGINAVGNDALFISVLITVIGLFLNLLHLRSRLLRVAGYVLVWCFMFLAFELRANAAPVLLCVLFTFALYCKQRFWRAALYALLIMISIGAAQKAIHHYGINAKKGYPLNYLYVSDMQAVSTLRGEWVPYMLEKEQYRINALPQSPREIPYAADAMNLYSTPLSAYMWRTDKQYADWLKDSWVRTLDSHPKELIIGRLFAFQQFLFAGRSLPFINDWLKSQYPGVIIAQDANARWWRNYISVSFFTYSLSNMAALLLLAFAGVLYLARRRSWFADEGLRLACLLASVSALYIATFIPFTFTSSQPRFYIVHSTCSLLALMILSLYLWGRKRARAHS